MNSHPRFWLACLLFSTVLVLGASTNFTSSCVDVGLSQDSLLSASCSTTVSSPTNDTLGECHDSEIDLNLCLGVDQLTGDLQWSI